MKTFSAELSRLHDMLDYVRTEANARGFDSGFVNKVELATEELLVNIINYGYPVRDPGIIEIECLLPSPKTFKIVVRDRGVPYNPLDHAANFDVASGPEQRAIGGYGIFLISKVMDEVAYERDHEENILTMIKHEKTA